MLIERIYYPVKTLGYGNRIGIWVSGCYKRCKNCSNPEMRSFNKNKDIKIETIFGIIKNIPQKIDGLTVTGGEPFEQSKELLELINFFKENYNDDILVYTGYKYKELINRNEQNINKIIRNISVLIDGEYIDELNDNMPLRGSSNQRIHILNKKYFNVYLKIILGKREVQNIVFNDKIIMIGIPIKDYREKISKGLLEHNINVNWE